MLTRLTRRAIASVAPAVRAVSSSAAVRAEDAGPEFGVYPGDRKIPYVNTLDKHDPADTPVIPIFRVMNEDATIRPGVPDLPLLGDSEEVRAELLEHYNTMIRVQEMDNIFYESQRQGRISFYMQNGGEEAAQVASAVALNKDDPIYAQYRELGVLMHRGFSLQQFADQCFSNDADLGKGRQMPVHYGSKELEIQTISSPLATQIPQASGAAYALQQEGKGRCVVCYFGEGAASEGDFHAALNFSSTLGGPVIFFCRNNGFAISTPVTDQYAGDGIATRGVSYGMHTMRVDGNDFFAVHHAVEEARKIAVDDGKPVLIEVMTYREGHHSTSDDSTRYRSPEEIKTWHNTANPVVRMRTYLEGKGWWDEDREKELRKVERKAVLKAMGVAEARPKPDVKELFTDVYAGEQPWNLRVQEEELTAHAAKYPEHYKHAEH